MNHQKGQIFSNSKTDSWTYLLFLIKYKKGSCYVINMIYFKHSNQFNVCNLAKRDIIPICQILK